MKIKYILYSLLIVGLLGSCKSKKKVVEKTSKHKKEVVVKQRTSSSKTIVTKPNKTTPIQNKTIAYINKFNGTAMDKMREYKIPASITLAQGILESGSGYSQLTQKSNNHFGIKCHKGWTGGKVYHDDDAKGECFRKYTDPAESFEDHSLFLVGRSRYAKLFKLKEGDYEAWAKGLSAAGYATDRRYPAKLIALIEKYDLHKYDTEVLGKRFVPKEVVSNKMDTYTVVKGDTLYSISRRYGLTVAELKHLNSLNSNEISIGQVLQIKK
ncbi:glucosaminidase domain-containing protein [Lutibacter sp. TH_r2]|uniref:glucosaminidase domain-containing protein n=1 Tax=Lutibacter sp. TH_r2 TaxID=3082083 RepID=UPI002955C641|nr:glucosaminidase domain-containing protein [Lutibacter sp. TH_r2]MDV7187079.1 glucosaminidase domain-containing protein [Lutibacter sp. TH_r2]